jgi:hypothetical protein
MPYSRVAEKGASRKLSCLVEVFSDTGLPPNGLLLGNYLCSVGIAGLLQRPELSVDPHDDGVQCDLQVVRFFWGAQALREGTGLVQLRSYLLQYV